MSDQNSGNGGGGLFPNPTLLSGPLNDIIGLAVVTGLLATIVQSLMSHMSNQSTNHQNAISASSHSSITGLATVARAVDQILGPTSARGGGTSSSRFEAAAQGAAANDYSSQSDPDPNNWGKPVVT